VKHNIVKTNRGNYMLPISQVKTKDSAREEMQDVSRSIVDLVPSPRGTSASDGFLYSFDRTESPVNVLSLDIFVKPDVQTEKLVEKEYEILDANGDALRGKKARRNLRKAASNPIETAPVEGDDEEFELI
jgi:hypothetical protein